MSETRRIEWWWDDPWIQEQFEDMDEFDGTPLTEDELERMSSYMNQEQGTVDAFHSAMSYIFERILKTRQGVSLPEDPDDEEDEEDED